MRAAIRPMPVQAEAAARSLLPADLERDDLRGPQADAAAAAVASIAGVRAALAGVSASSSRCATGAVLDGRDIGTVIFPNAAAKLFVTASLVERARRRWLELQAKGIDADLGHSRSRHAPTATPRTQPAPPAPLRAAADALTLDTSGIDAEAALRNRTNVRSQAHPASLIPLPVRIGTIPLARTGQSG